MVIGFGERGRGSTGIEDEEEEEEEEESWVGYPIVRVRLRK
jgi:hypothetical protein